MLVVIAIGGNGLLGSERGLDADVHRAGARAVARAVAEVARHHRVVVTHGSAPQVGLFAYQSTLWVESACRFVFRTGKRAAIGAVGDAATLCAGTTGTQIAAYEFEPALLSGVPGGAVR